MNRSPSRADPIIDVVIPALNEAAGIAAVLDAIPPIVRDVVVADNGSTDETGSVAASRGARVVREPRRGYGAACLAALAALRDPDIVVFLDADHSDRPKEMPRLIEPIVDGAADLVIGSRVRGRAEPGSLTLPQRFGNRLATALIRRIWRSAGGGDCTDLGPFRAVRFDALRRLAMDDLDYGWTVQMQARAYRLGLRVTEVPVTYQRRIGRSKISGTVRGVVGAGYKILTTIAREAAAGRAARRRGQSSTSQRLIVFTRAPEPGRTKTRLIPALGPDGAAELQREMSAYTLAIVRQWRDDEAGAAAQIDVRCTGGSINATRSAVADPDRDDMAWRDQGDGTLGERLDRAVREAAAEHAGPVVIIGSDCPQITPRILRSAFAALNNGSDMVIGPATDGGYYLIGVTSPHPSLFRDIDWGSDHVFEQTMQAARQAHLRVARLETLRDVDESIDLPVWHAAKAAAQPSGMPPALSIIVPALNEASHLEAAIASVGARDHVEIIVVDGGSTDSTVDIANRCGTRVLQSAPGRAQQMNAGAAVARGDVLLFLHADTRLPFGYREAISAALCQPGVVAGAFRLAFDQVSQSLRLIERGANLRSQWRQLPYGDQAIFLPRQRFIEAGGFPELSVMEDYEFAARLQQRGRIALAPLHVITSARRWRAHGPWRTTCRHQVAIALYRLGVTPDRISRFLGRTTGVEEDACDASDAGVTSGGQAHRSAVQLSQKA